MPVKDSSTIKSLRRDPFVKPDTTNAPKRKVVSTTKVNVETDASPPKKKKKPLVKKAGRQKRKGATTKGTGSSATKKPPTPPKSAVGRRMGSKYLKVNKR